jgi:hypothetical protein
MQRSRGAAAAPRMLRGASSGISADAASCDEPSPRSRGGARLLWAAISRGGGAPAPARSSVFRAVFIFLLVNVASVFFRLRSTGEDAAGDDDDGAATPSVGAWLASARCARAAYHAAAQAAWLVSAVWLLSACCAHGLAKIATALTPARATADARARAPPLADAPDGDDARLAALLQVRHAAPHFGCNPRAVPD